MVMAAQRRGHEAGNRAWRAEDGPNPLDFTRESVLAKLVRDTGDAGRYVFTVDGSRERRETAVNSLRFGSGHFATMRGLAAGDDNLGFYPRPGRSVAVNLALDRLGPWNHASPPSSISGARWSPTTAGRSG